MRKLKCPVFLLFLALLVPDNSFAYKLSVDSIPLNLRENADAVIRSDQIVFTVESTGKAKANFKRVITLMNENAEDLRVFWIYYDKFRSVQNIRTSVYDANGKFIESVSSSKIMDISEGEDFISDARMKRILFPLNRYPYTIEVEYELIMNGLINLPRWDFQRSPLYSVEESAVQFIIPKSIPFRFREYYMHSSADTVIIGDNYIYTWTERNIPAINKWYFSPLSTARRPVLLTAINDFEFGGVKGSMESWKSFGLWQATINEGLDQLSDAEKQRVVSLTAGLADDMAKAKALYNYMQSRTRYVSIQLGIGGLKPAPAAEVSEKGYGDCKGLTNYMHALLKEAGIQSFYTLVKSGANRNIISSFVSDQFDHIILCVPVKSDTVWLECTSQTTPFGFLGTFTSDRNVLVITPDGGKLVRTPALKSNYMKITGLIEIARRNASNGKIKVTSGGSAFDNDLMTYLGKTETEIKRYLNSNLKLGTFVVDSAVYFENREGDPFSTLSYKVQMSDFSVAIGKRIHFRPCLEPFDYQPFDTIAVRVYPMPSETDSLIFKMPYGYQPEFIPESVNMECPAGKYIYKISQLDESSLLFKRELKINDGIYSGDKARELFAFLNTVAEKDHRRIFLAR